LSEAETIQFSPRNRAGAQTTSAHAHSSHPATTCFTRPELNAILNLYGRKVAAGEWRDYAIDFGREKAVFSVFRRASEVPLYRIEKNPKLVVVRISGWGQDGPYRRRPGFGSLIEGMSGFAAINGFGDREPVLPPMYLADGFAGLFGASAALIALRAAEQSGRGQVVDLPLLDPLFAMLGPQAAAYRLTGKIKPRTGSRSTNSAPRNVYRCKDGLYVALSASTQKMAERTLSAVGRPELIDDPRYRTNGERVKHAAELDAIIGAFIAQRTQAENVAFFEQAEVTIGPIYDVRQILEDPHFIEREIIADYPDDEMDAFPMHHVVPRLLGTPGSIRSPAPKLGQHNRELLGVSASEYKRLLETGVVHE